MDKSVDIKEAIVLAGGLGTRLRSEIGTLPKPLASVNGKPFLQILLNYLKLNGIDRVILAVGYKWEMIEAQFGNVYNGIEIVYSVENEPLGTGGALKLALAQVKSDCVFVFNGDTLFSIPLLDLAQAHLQKDVECTLALNYLEKNVRHGNVLLNEENFIQQFIEKGEAGAGFINGGIYLLKKTALSRFMANTPFSFELDYLTKHADEKTLLGIPFDAYFKDIGIPEDYHQFERDLKNKEFRNLH